jgi:hypothetical protein
MPKNAKKDPTMDPKAEASLSEKVAPVPDGKAFGLASLSPN